MIAIGLDPGTEQSALVAYDGTKVITHRMLTNGDMLEWLATVPSNGGATLVVEDIQSYGMAVGVETFRTVLWSGRFIQEWYRQGKPFALLGRRDVKLHLCFSNRATDANIRAALLDKFGPGKTKAIGVKAAQGPLYGIKGHEYAALAVAVTYWEQHHD